MRKLGYSLLALVFLLLIAVPVLNAYMLAQRESGLSETREGYRTISAYALQSNKSLRFEYPKSSVSAKFLIHVITENISSEDTAESPLTFSLNYSIGGSDKLISNTLSTRISEYRHIETNELVSAYMLDNAELTVSNSNTIEMSLLNRKKNRIALSLGEIDPRIKQVVVRSFYRVGSSVKSANIKWARLSKRERTRLTRFHPFGNDFISQDEINNVLKNRNLAIAPAGIDGVEFLSQPLQVYDEPDQILAARTNQGSTYLETLSPNLHRAVRVFEPATLNITTLKLSDDTTENTLYYEHVNAAGELIQKSARLNDGGLELPLAPGDYIFKANTANEFVIADTPLADTQGRRSQYYKLAEESIRYSINQSGYGEQFIKLELLSLPMARLALNYTFLNADNLVISGGEVSHQKAVNPFLHPRKPEQIASLSDISSTILRVPVEASKLELKSTTGSGYLKLSNSLASLSTKIRISGAQTDFTSKWFALMPDKQTLGAAEDDLASASLAIINYGRYQFVQNDTLALVTSLTPNKLAPSSIAYETVEPEPGDDIGSAIIFSQIDFNQLLQWDLYAGSIASDNTKRLRAFYLNPGNTGTKVKIIIDGKPYDYALPYQSGELQLPDLQVGKHTIKVIVSNSASDETLQLFLNFIPPGDTLLKRRELYLTKREINFKTLKPLADDQLLQFVIAQKKDADTLDFEVQIENQNSGTVIARRQYSVASADTQVNGLLATDTVPSLRILPPVYIKPDQGFSEHGNLVSLKFSDGESRYVAVKVLDKSGVTLGQSYIDRVSQ